MNGDRPFGWGGYLVARTRDFRFHITQVTALPCVTLLLSLRHRTFTRRLAWLALCLACGISFQVVAQAPAAGTPAVTRTAAEEQARAHYRTGSIAFSAGRFADALTEFQKSHALSQRPELIYNIAVAFDRLRRDREALDAFEEYLRLVPDAPQRAEVEGRVALLREALQSHAQLAATSATTTPAPDRAPTDSASHTPTGVTTSTNVTSEAAAPQAPRAQADEPTAHPNVGQWLALGSAAATAVTGGVLLTVALLDKGSVERPEDGVRLGEIESAHDRVPLLSTVGGVMLGVGLAGAGAAMTWMLLTGPSAEVETQVGVGHVSIRGRF